VLLTLSLHRLAAMFFIPFGKLGGGGGGALPPNSVGEPAQAVLGGGDPP